MKKIILIALSIVASACGSANPESQTKTVQGFDKNGQFVQKTVLVRPGITCLKVWTDFEQACIDGGFELVYADCEPLCSSQ